MLSCSGSVSFYWFTFVGLQLQADTGNPAVVNLGPPLKGSAILIPNPTRSSTIVEGTCDAPCQLKRARCHTNDKSCNKINLKHDGTAIDGEDDTDSIRVLFLSAADSR